MSKIENLNLSSLLSQNMNQNKNVNSDSAFKDIFSRVSDNPQDKPVQSSKKEFEPKAQDTEKKPIEKNQVSESKS
mgnify:CR=1 FL=1